MILCNMVATPQLIDSSLGAHIQLAVQRIQLCRNSNGKGATVRPLSIVSLQLLNFLCHQRRG